MQITDYYRVQVGDTFRSIRRQRGVTLEQMSRRCGMSVPVLSRKETGRQPFTRKDIELWITALHLSPVEAHEVWRMAGLVAHVAHHPRCPYVDIAPEINHILQHTNVPSVLLTTQGMVRAWSGWFELLLNVSQCLDPCDPRAIHIFDVLAAIPTAAQEPVYLYAEPAQMPPEQQFVQGMVGYLIEWLSLHHEPDITTMFLERLPNNALARLIQICLPPMLRERLAGTPPLYPRRILPIPTEIGIVELIATRCAIADPHGLIMVMLLPYGDQGQAICTTLRDKHDHFKPVYVL